MFLFCAGISGSPWAHMLPQSLWACVCICPGVWKCCFLEVFHPLAFTAFFSSLFWALKEEYGPTWDWTIESLLVSPCSPVVALWINHHLLYEDHFSDISCRQVIIVAFRPNYFKLWVISSIFHLMLLNHLTPRNQICRQRNHRRRNACLHRRGNLCWNLLKSLYFETISGLKESHKWSTKNPSMSFAIYP